MAFTFDSAGTAAAAAGFAAAATHAEIWNGDPTAGGVKTSNERGAIVLSGASVLTLDATESFTGAAGAGATHVVLFDDPVAGNRLGYGTLDGDQAFNAAGEYDLTGVAIVVG